MKLEGKALVVDDEEDVREIIGEHLLSFGLQVDLAGNVNEALGKLQDQGKAYKYILTDLKMPNQSGISLIKEIMKMEHLAETKVVVISGVDLTAFSDDQVAALSDFIDDYLEKPFEREDIYNILSGKAEAGDDEDEDEDEDDDED